MKPKLKKGFIYGAALTFAIATAYIIVYAFWNQKQSELIYLIFNSYAIVAVVLCLLLALYWKRTQRRRAEEQSRRFNSMVKNLAAPAMLWDDDLNMVIPNERLIAITELEKREEGFDPKFLVPWLFGKTQMSDTEMREIVAKKNGEYSFMSKKGTPHDMIWNTSAISSDEDGNTLFLSIGFDLGEIRNMQSEIRNYSRKLAASEGKHTLSMELTEIGILLGEQGSKTVFPSPELQKMLGLSGNTIDIDELRSRVYPMDEMLFENHLKATEQHMEQFLDEVQIMEIRFCGADGLYRWYNYRFKAAKGENGKLVIGGAFIDITKEKEKDAKIEQIAYEDAVTKIPNRNKLIRMGEELYQCTTELNSSYWVIVMDIDRFHIINDTCGYENGNELLRIFSAAMMRQLKYGGFGARISGDNFALILKNTGDMGMPPRVIQKIQHDLASQAVGVFANRTLTCSAGYAQMPRDGENFEQVLEHAEFALSTGRETAGSIDRYTPQMHDSIIRENELEKRLADAIPRKELFLVYHPKMRLSDGAIIGLEALVRWRQPDGTIISPAEFIPVAEKSLLITQVTRFVLYEACRQTKIWQDMGLPKIVMSINMSGADFYQETLCAQVSSALQLYQLEPQYLEIELTESLALRDVDMTIKQMQQLRNAGIHLAMDDFGTGYSSLSYIQKLPFSMLKLDQSFTRSMETDPVVREIVHSVIQIARAKQIETVAEGVETPQQAKFLREIGCGNAQGDLYHAPMSADETEQFIRQNMEQKTVY